MQRMRRYILIALVLQLAMVLTGHFVHGVRDLSGVFGTGIPLVLGWLYAVRAPLAFRDATIGGIAIGAVGAAAALLLAVLLGDQPWDLLLLGTLSSAVTGWLGALIGRMVQRGKAGRAG